MSPTKNKAVASKTDDAMTHPETIYTPTTPTSTTPTSIPAEQSKISSPTRSSRAQKRSKKWKTYRKAFGSPPSGHVGANMSALDFPHPVAERCPELNAEWQALASKSDRVFSNSNKSDNKEAVDDFLDQVQEIYEDQSKILKRARQASAEWNDIESPKKQKLAETLAETEFEVLKRRTILLSSKRTLQGEILCRTPVSLIADAFLDRFLLKDELCSAWPAGSTLDRGEYAKLLGSESSNDRGRRAPKFRNLIKIRYNSSRLIERGNEQIWDPIIGRWLHSSQMTAGHIVPISVGEFDYARLIGRDWVTEDTISDTLWSDENGLLIHRDLERFLDKGVFVIVPTSIDNGIREYKMVILHDQPRDDTIFLGGGRQDIKFGDLDGRQLQWLNDSRPSATNLYIRYLLTRILRRKAFAVGWERDIERVPTGVAWAEIGPLRYSMLRHLCEELGDFVSDSGAIKSVLDEGVKTTVVPETGGQEPEQQAVTRGMAVRVSGAWIEEADYDSDGSI